ncbi:hypothetical protein Q8F55_004442 [Vanrija albida]|uniref:Uncharacterized protein n=1 Tax=Vanrija albida TaxID=181172 RepID=A0ABR3Q7K9_9TREE
MSTTSVSVPILQLNFASGTAANCIQSICGFNTGECGLEPRQVEVQIKKAIDAKACPSDRSFINITTTGLDKTIPTNEYPGTCTFNSAACASAVCGLLHTAVNATDGKSICHADPAIADAAVSGRYWFASNATACKDDKPVCKGFDDYVKASDPAPKSGAPVNLAVSAPLAILAATTGLLGLVGACGFTLA